MSYTNVNTNISERQQQKLKLAVDTKSPVSIRPGVKLGQSGPELRPKVFHKGGARSPAVVWSSKRKSGWNNIVQLECSWFLVDQRHNALS